MTTTMKQNRQLRLDVLRVTRPTFDGVLSLTVRLACADLEALRAAAVSGFDGPELEASVRAAVAEQAAEALALYRKVAGIRQAVAALQVDRDQLEVDRKKALTKLEGEALAEALGRLKERDEDLAERSARTAAGLKQLEQLSTDARLAVLAAGRRAGERHARQYHRDGKQIATALANGLGPLLADYFVVVERADHLSGLLVDAGERIAQQFLESAQQQTKGVQ